MLSAKKVLKKMKDKSSAEPKASQKEAAPSPLDGKASAGKDVKAPEAKPSPENEKKTTSHQSNKTPVDPMIQSKSGETRSNFYSNPSKEDAWTSSEVQDAFGFRGRFYSYRSAH